MTASVLCLAHCLLLPALLLALPMLAAVLVLPESFHMVAFAGALPTSMMALHSGHRRHGRGGGPVTVAIVGLTLLGLGAFAIAGEAAELAISSVGAVLLAIAHAWNWHATSHARRPVPSCPAEEDA